MKQVRKFFQLITLLLFSLKSFASEPITREGEIPFILSAKNFIAKQKYNKAIECLEETFFHSKERDKMLENLEKIFREKKDFPALIKTLNK